MTAQSPAVDAGGDTGKKKKKKKKKKKQDTESGTNEVSFGNFLYTWLIWPLKMLD